MWNGHNHILTGNEPFLGLVFSYFNKKRLPHNQLNRLIVQQPLYVLRNCKNKLYNLYAIYLKPKVQSLTGKSSIVQVGDVAWKNL